MHVAIPGSVLLLAAGVAGSFAADSYRLTAPPPDRPPTCDATVTVPAGFCAVLYAEGLGAPRHIAVAANGDLFAALRRGGVVALRDTNADGVADVRRQFGEGRFDGIALEGGFLYAARESQVIRWTWASGQLEPAGAAQVIVRDMPTGGHTAKTIAVRGEYVYVDHGSLTNSCQQNDRGERSPGIAGCPELQTRAGIWRYRADRTDQRPADGIRFATGTRNPMALAFEPTTGTLWMSSHGRDQLSANWGFTVEQNAELPAEEFGPVVEGADYGWPFCYHDGLVGRKVLAPEYGGDGRRVGQCAQKTMPAVAFPGHWAPMAIAFAGGTTLPAEYREGAFVAFHGSWNRAPLPQAGFRVSFVPFRGGQVAGQYRDFFQGNGGVVRPSGLAVGVDGSVYVAADAQGKVWRVTYTGR